MNKILKENQQKLIFMKTFKNELSNMIQILNQSLWYNKYMIDDELKL